jgi:hypothetical protein
LGWAPEFAGLILIWIEAKLAMNGINGPLAAFFLTLFCELQTFVFAAQSQRKNTEMISLWHKSINLTGIPKNAFSLEKNKICVLFM